LDAGLVTTIGTGEPGRCDRGHRAPKNIPLSQYLMVKVR
jgi:hypothetical protein